MAGRRSRARRAARRLGLRRLPQLLLLPPAVLRFQVRAWAWADRHGDEFSLVSATQPANLRTLLRVAGSSAYVVELGTGTAWTTISLALARRGRRITSFDPVERDREPYLRLAGRARERIELVDAPGERGPVSDAPVDLLFVDSSHTRESVLREYAAWRPAMRPGGLIVLDDYDHPDWPGVREAADELGLAGEQRGALFVHRVPAP